MSFVVGDDTPGTRKVTTAAVHITHAWFASYPILGGIDWD